MSQLNLNVTAEFSKDLAQYMKHTGIRQKSEAIRKAVREATEHALAAAQGRDFNEWLGLANAAPRSKTPRFNDDNDLWT